VLSLPSGLPSRSSRSPSRGDPLLRRSVGASGRPAGTQVSRCIGLSGSDRNFPVLTGRSGTQRARPLRPQLAAPLGGWPLSQLTEGVGGGSCLLLSGVVAALGCCIVTTRTWQGMARVRSGQAPAWPLSSDRSVRRGSGVKRDFACTITRHFLPVLVARRSRSRLRLEGRTRTLSGSSPDLSPARTPVGYKIARVGSA
jgi:hypothetical protein